MNNPTTTNTTMNNTTRGSGVIDSENSLLGNPDANAVGSITSLPSAGDELAGLVDYRDTNQGTNVDFEHLQDSTFYQDYTVGAELQEFFSRPVLIDTFEWELGQEINKSYDVWELYFNHPPIRRKIDNYGLLSCNLKVKVIINATPFYYGAALVSYRPLSGYLPESNIYVPSIAKDMGLMARSQRPHFYMYPQTNHGGEMVLPFFLHRNWLAVPDLGDFTRMGVLNIDSVTPLRAASAATTPITISVFVWTENLKLAAPTESMALQSDEYMVSSVSGISSAVAEATGALSKIPVISPFMKATSFVASSFASVAKFFGFTNVPVIDNVRPFKDVPFHAFASSEISVPKEKLTLDPKNELTIDPRTVGLPPDDELIISKFVGREAYLGQTLWETNDPVNELLRGIDIQPSYVTFNNVVDSNVFQSTPLFTATQPFAFWRGDIIFRLRIICTQYHRGRLRVTFDPFGDIFTNTDTYTTNFTRVIDISKDRDIEFRVPYMQALPFLRAYSGQRTIFHNISAKPDQIGIFSNGSLTFRVVTSLSAPVDSAPVLLIFSVRAADNFEVAGPRALPVDISTLQLQSDEMVYENPELVSASNNPGSNADPHRYLTNMGEVVKSFRTLLRRTNAYRTDVFDLPITASQTDVLVRMVRPRFPLPYGYPPVGVEALDRADSAVTPGTERRFNFVHNVMLTWLLPCFLAYRGAINWDVNVDAVQHVNDMKIYRSYQVRTNSNKSATTAIASSASNPSMVRTYLYNSTCLLEGGTLTNQKTQSGLQACIPDYNAARFRFAHEREIFPGTFKDGSEIDSVGIDITLNNGLATTSKCKIWQYVSAGPDFNFFFFVNTPSYLYLGEPELPVV